MKRETAIKISKFAHEAMQSAVRSVMQRKYAIVFFWEMMEVPMMLYKGGFTHMEDDSAHFFTFDEAMLLMDFWKEEIRNGGLKGQLVMFDGDDEVVREEVIDG